MPDVLGWRKKFGVLLPSSNTISCIRIPANLRVSGMTFSRSREGAVCEHCSTGTKWTKSFGEEDGICEYSLEPEEGRERSGGCPNHPVAWSFERFVEDHLCQRHMEEEDVSLDEGLGEFLREGGLQVSTDFLPITELQLPPCSYLVFADESGQDRSPCGQPAKHAKMVIERWSFCQEHLEEW